MEEAKADWEKGWAWAKYDPSKTSPEKLVEAVNQNTAFQAKLPEKDRRKKKEEGREILRVDPVLQPFGLKETVELLSGHTVNRVY